MSHQPKAWVRTNGFRGVFPWAANYDSLQYNNSLIPWVNQGLGRGAAASELGGGGGGAARGAPNRSDDDFDQTGSAPINDSVLVAIPTAAPIKDAATPALRDVVVENREFVSTKTGEKVVLTGANVVVKGAPWLPTTDGNAVCDTPANPSTNTSCRTFNAADAKHLTQTLGYNFIRLGVVWAGAQPDSTDALDPVWVAKLQVSSGVLGVSHCRLLDPAWVAKLQVSSGVSHCRLLDRFEV
jgi:hypothetical protein